MTATSSARPTHSLIVSTIAMFPLEQAVDGIFTRLKLFVSAVAEISSSVSILFLVPDVDVVSDQHTKGLDKRLSAFWGIEIRARFVLSQPRRTGFYAHYINGIWSAADQPAIAHYTGADQLRAVAEALDAAPDLVLVFGLPAMVAVLKTGRRPARLFFDLNDVEHRVRIRTALAPPIWPGKLAYLAQAPALFFAERSAAAVCRSMFVCSDVDLNYLKRWRYPGKLIAVPNAVPIPEQVGPLTASPVLLFLGGYGYGPNRDAAERLITRIWPLVRTKRPDARLVIAGKSPEHIPSFVDCPERVEFTGFVTDLDALYARVRVITCPITSGGGTRLKLLEAAAYGKPMVSTSIGAEGLKFRTGQEIMIADHDVAFAAACLHLLDDDAEAGRLGDAARAAVCETYDLSVIAQGLASVLMER
eukprot:gene5819-5884_t